MGNVLNKFLRRMYRLPEEKIIQIQEEANERAMKQWYDSLMVNPLLSYFTLGDIAKINEIALSPVLNNKPTEKYKQIGEIMNKRGFVFIGGGTNRRTYSCTYDTRVVAKVATDKVGLSNNHRELVNQEVLKPFCCKVFEVSQCGTLAIIERVKPVMNLDEFEDIIDRVFDILVHKIRNKNIGMEDIGSRSFKNWGIRDGFGPVLLDYPTMYVVNPKKCYCSQIDPYGNLCNCSLDYDEGFDNIICTGCGRRYLSKSLAKKNGDDITELIYAAGNMNQAVMKGRTSNMKIRVVKNGEVIHTSKITDGGNTNYVDEPVTDNEVTTNKEPESSVMSPPSTNTFKVRVFKGEKVKEPEEKKVTVFDNIPDNSDYYFEILTLLTCTGKESEFWNFLDRFGSSISEPPITHDDNDIMYYRKSVFNALFNNLVNASDYFYNIINEATALRQKIEVTDNKYNKLLSDYGLDEEDNECNVYPYMSNMNIVTCIYNCLESARIALYTSKLNVDIVKTTFYKFQEANPLEETHVLVRIKKPNDEYPSYFVIPINDGSNNTESESTVDFNVENLTDNNIETSVEDDCVFTSIDDSNKESDEVITEDSDPDEDEEINNTSEDEEINNNTNESDDDNDIYNILASLFVSLESTTEYCELIKTFRNTKKTSKQNINHHNEGTENYEYNLTLHEYTSMVLDRIEGLKRLVKDPNLDHISDRAHEKMTTNNESLSSESYRHYNPDKAKATDNFNRRNKKNKR